MKKLLAVLLCVIMLFTFAGCKRGTDLEEVMDAGKIVIGITDYEPLNYKVDGEWTGFDTELARLFAKKLGVKAEFVEIDWKDKYDLLDEYEIDCVWNGMTVIYEYQVNHTMSNPYIYCGQILVMQADVVDNYKNGYDVRKLKFAVEEGSAADACMFREGYENVTKTLTQYDALDAVASGKADCAVVDNILATRLVGKGKKYENLSLGFDYSSETVAVGFRKDSDLAEKVNEFFEEIRDTDLIDLANKYGLTLC